jgi:hypothetical protein
MTVFRFDLYVATTNSDGGEVCGFLWAITPIYLW